MLKHALTGPAREYTRLPAAFFLRVLLLSMLITLGLGGLDQAMAQVEATPVETAPALEAPPSPAALPESEPVEEAPLEPDSGHNAWMMMSTALVLFMTLPGLALFYGGLVRHKNVLSVMAQCLGSAGLVTVLWWFVGYSLVFGDADGHPIIGGFQYMFLNGVGGAPNPAIAAGPSHAVFAMFQLMFAIITPALIVGAIAERMKFSAIMIFIGFWVFLVYFPLAHMIWGGAGFMNGLGNPNSAIQAIDFAGGTVVHMSSGWSALVLCLILGPRRGYGKAPMPPHSLVLCMAGTGILWFGWFGFNAGSALAADGIAAQAFLTTTLCPATAGLVWAITEKIVRGKASVLGFCSGIVGGLVVITPAAGFVSANSAIIMGVIAGLVCYLGCTVIKKAFKYDDSLDTFGVHGIGGTVGALLTGVFADASINPALNTNLSGLVGGMLWLEQLKAMLITIVGSVVMTIIIVIIVKAMVGLRPSAEDEEQGLDITDHGEEGYVLE